MICKFDHDGDCCNCGSPHYKDRCRPLLCDCGTSMTNADRIRTLSDEEMAKYLDTLTWKEPAWDRWFNEEFCKKCKPLVGEYEGKTIEFHECETCDGECPHGDATLLWLRMPAEVPEYA